MIEALTIAICLFAAFAAGAWLEQGGESEDKEYDDE